MKPLLAFWVHRPLLTNLVTALVVLAGLLALGNVKYEVIPQVDLGIVNITTARTGAGPEDIELSVTVPLEEEVLKVDDLKKVYSASMEDVSVLTLRLDPAVEDKSRTLADIQKAVDRASARLPPDLPEKALVEEMSSLKFPVMELHLVGQVPEAALRRAARQIADAVRELQGSCRRGSGVQPAGSSPESHRPHRPARSDWRPGQRLPGHGLHPQPPCGRAGSLPERRATRPRGGAPPTPHSYHLADHGGRPFPDRLRGARHAG